MAAQLDQYRPGNRHTAGAVKSVKRVQRQLRRRGISVAVDGNFGAQTMNGYAAWQRRLGLLRARRERHARRDVSEAARRPPLQRDPRRAAGRPPRLERGDAQRAHDPDAQDRGSPRRRPPLRRSTPPRAPTRARTAARRPRTPAAARSTSASARAAGARSSAWSASCAASGSRPGSATGPGNQHIHAVAISDPDMANEIAFPGWFDMREQVVGFAQKKNGLNGATTGKMTAPAPHVGAVQAVPVTSPAARIAPAIRAAQRFSRRRR